jgi:hypothetical protein
LPTSGYNQNIFSKVAAAFAAAFLLGESFRRFIEYTICNISQNIFVSCCISNFCVGVIPGWSASLMLQVLVLLTNMGLFYTGNSPNLENSFMLTLPKISLAQTSFAALAFFALSFFEPGSETNDFRNCSTAEPFTVNISGFYVTGHVCGQSELKLPHQLNFKLHADEDQQPIILKQLSGFSDKSHNDAETIHD